MLSCMALEQMATEHQQELLREAETERRIREMQRGAQAAVPGRRGESETRRRIPALRRLIFFASLLHR